MLLFDSFYHLIRYFIATNFIFNNKMLPNAKYNKFTIVIPVLCEEKNIQRVLKSLCKMNYLTENFNVFFITTQREYLNKTDTNTIYYIDEFIKENETNNIINRIHSPDFDGNRITQLNFALNIFKQMPDFSNYVEDVRLGHICSFLKIKSLSIKNVILETESAKKYSIMLKQTALWFLGCSLIFEDFLKAQRLNQNISLKTCWFKILTLYFENFRWMLKNIFNTGLLLFSIINGNILLFAVAILTYIINSFISVLFVINNKNIVIFNRNQKTLAIIGALLIYPIYSLGTFYGFLKLLKYILIKQVNVYKTER